MRDKLYKIISDARIAESNTDRIVNNIMEVLEEKEEFGACLCSECGEPLIYGEYVHPGICLKCSNPEPPEWEKRFDETVRSQCMGGEPGVVYDKDGSRIKDFIRSLLEEKDKEIEKYKKVVEAADTLMQGSNRIVIAWQNRLKEALSEIKE